MYSLSVIEHTFTSYYTRIIQSLFTRYNDNTRD